MAKSLINVKKSVGVFCGASNAVDERWMEIATELGRLIAGENFRLVYGGGRVGLMAVSYTHLTLPTILLV